MNCCNTFGDCTQGRDCPARTGTVLPYQARHAAQVAAHHPHRHTCTELGVRQNRPDCECPQPIPPEAGNVRLPPVDHDDMSPLGHEETMALIWALFGWFMAVVCTITVMAVAVGYSTERWADVFLAYLSGLS